MSTQDSSRVGLASPTRQAVTDGRAQTIVSEPQKPDNELQDPGMYCWALIEHGCFYALVLPFGTKNVFNFLFLSPKNFVYCNKYFHGIQQNSEFL